uniref:Uncharacterized protein n=1 Tax=Chenopodium quinoa TaxID=63459 RepID=A0A803M2Z7_CHEQI
THVVVDICPVVANVESKNVLNFVFVLSFEMQTILSYYNSSLYVNDKMQTQHKLELDKRDGIISAFPIMAVPPVQQMSRMDPRAHPPSVAGNPQIAVAYGYPAR